MTKRSKYFSSGGAVASTRVVVLSGIISLGAQLLPAALPQLGAEAAPAPHPVRPVLRQHDVQTLREVTAAAPADPSLTARAASTAGARAVALGGKDRVVEVPVEGRLVGLSWPAKTNSNEPVAVAWRSRQADGSWTGWTPVTATSQADPSARGTDRVSTDPFWVGGAKAIELRYPASDPRIKAARVEEVEPGTSPADQPATASGNSAVALTSRPTIFSRAQWGADESLRQGCVPTIGNRINGVVVHHDAGSNSYTAADSAAIIRSIYAYHTQVNGWCDIGYNVIVDKYGQAFEGRYGGLNLPVQGAHALGFNEDSFGISMLGNYMTATPTSAGLDILARVIAWRLSGVYRNGTGTTQWHGGAATTRYPNVGTYTLPMIIGHRDVNYTDCPGTNLYAALPSVRTRVSQLISYTSSPIYSRYTATGGSANWGPVWMAETPVGAGMNEMIASGGARFYSTPSFGTRWMGPGLDGMWRSLGWTSWGGYPWTDEITTPPGWYVELEKGKTLTMTREGAGTWTEGAVRNYWVSQANGSYGVLRMPVERMTLVAGFWQQRFQGGTVYFNTANGQTVHTEGGMDTYYRDHGFLTGSMGTPTTDVVSTATGAQQGFTAGVLRWDRASDAITFSAR